MKHLRFLLGALASSLALGLRGQEPPATAAASAEIPTILLSAEQLEQLLGPIALYPDALIALILPAATAPADIVLAARYLKERGPDLSQVEHRSWDESVKSLIHYPEVIRWMDENLTWTKQVGEAFAAQPAEAMNAVQRLRARARAAGTLVDTPQQQVLTEASVIRIVPSQPEIIYVPRYDPAVVFVDRPVYYSRPLLTFGAGCRVGSWLAHDFDWHRSTLWIGDRRRQWHGRHDWRHPVVPIVSRPGNYHRPAPAPRPWQPPLRSPRVYSSVRPTPHHGAGAAAHVTPPVHHRPGNPLGYRSATPEHPLPHVSPLPRGTRPAEPTVVIPPAPVVSRSQPSAFPGDRPQDRSRSYENRGRTYPSPPATSAPLPSVAPLSMTPPPTRHFPTVAAPQIDRGASSRVSRPVPVAPLQRTAPSHQPAATEPSAPAAPAASAESSNQTSPHSQPGPQQRGRRAF